MGSWLPSPNTSVLRDVGIVPTCVQLSFVKYFLLSEYMNTWLKIVRGMYCTCMHNMCMYIYSICGSIFSTSFGKNKVWFGPELSNHSTVAHPLRVSPACGMLGVVVCFVLYTSLWATLHFHVCGCDVLGSEYH